MKGQGEWTVIRVSATEADWITDESLEQEEAAYGDDQALARQELHAEFISDENAVFKDTHFTHLYREDYKNYHPYNAKYNYHMSVDVGWDSNRAVIMVGHWEEMINKWGDTEKYIKVDMITSFLQPDPQDFQDAIVKWIEEYHVRFVVPDGQSVGVETLKRLRKRIRKEGRRVKIYTSDKLGTKLGFITTGGSGVHSKTNLVSEGVARASRQEIRLPSHTQTKGEESYELEQEMRAFAYENSALGASVKFGRGVNEEPDDRVLALLYLIFSFTIRVGSGSAYGASTTRDHPGQRVKYKGRSSLEDSGIAHSGRDIRRGTEYVRRQRQTQRNYGKY